MTTLEAERRRRLIANSLYLEARSVALLNHSRELCAEAQRMRARHERLSARWANVRHWRRRPYNVKPASERE